MGNMVPLVMLHQIATAKDAESELKFERDVRVSSRGVKRKRKSVPSSLVPKPETESFGSNTDLCMSCTSAKGKRKRVAACVGGERKKKTSAPSPYSSWNGTGMKAWGQGGEVGGFPPP